MAEFTKYTFQVNLEVTPTPTPSPRFNVGDRVRALPQWEGHGLSGTVESETTDPRRVNVHWDNFELRPVPRHHLTHLESAGARTPADAEPPGPALPEASLDRAAPRGTPALYPHACLRCGAPAFHNAVTAECSRGAECGVVREPVVRCVPGTGSVGRLGSSSEEPYWTAWCDRPYVSAHAATEEAAIAAVRRRLGKQ